MTFKVGDVVTWRSQSAGVWKVKQGEIAMVIPAGKRPASKDSGLFRDHESYTVRVREIGESGGVKSSRLYWPRVAQLTKVSNDS